MIYEGANAIYLRAALGFWVRAELLRLGASPDEVLLGMFDRYRLEIGNFSPDSLREHLALHNTDIIPFCLFRPTVAAESELATNEAFTKAGFTVNKDSLRGPSVTILPNLNHELDLHQITVLSQLDWSKIEFEDGVVPLRGEDLPSDKTGILRFVRKLGARQAKRPVEPDALKISGEGDRTVEWSVTSRSIWQGVETDLQLHSGSFRLEFAVDSLQNYQLGIGFMLAWSTFPDWGFYGYLGSSTSAWAYDPYSGDIVFATESIAGRLPKLDSTATSDAGIIALQLDLPRDNYGRAQFIVNGVETPAFLLPRSAVVVPAVCLLRKGQRVKLKSLLKAPVSSESLAAIKAEGKRLKTLWRPSERRLPTK